jgi:Stage II sporulation protein M
MADRGRGDVVGASVALQVEPVQADARVMDASAYAFTHGVRHTRATLRAWHNDPGRVLGQWVLGSAIAAAGLLMAVWGVALLDTGHQQVITLQPPFAVGNLSDVLTVLERNMLVLALHAMACVAGFIAGSSLPLQAEHREGVSRWVHEHGGRLAIGFVALATAFSLSAQAYLIGSTLAGVSAFLRVSPGTLLLGLLPHAIPELIALFLPLAAWIIASRRGEWEQLLAATFVTVAVAVPVLVIAAFIEVYVSPHLFTALTHIHPPIVRNSEGWLVTVH